MRISNHPFSFYQEAPTAIRVFRCPSCDETISAEARNCRFCNLAIDAATAEQLIRENQRVTNAVAKANTFRLSVLMAALMTIGAIMNLLTQGSLIPVFVPLIAIGYGVYWLYQNRSLVTKDSDFPLAVKKVKLTIVVWVGALVVGVAIATWNVAKLGPFTQQPGVELQANNPLTFELAGPGSITNFSVGIFTPSLPEESPDRVQIIWELTPNDIFNDSTKVEAVGRINYGTVPNGFRETQPAPPLSSLEPGKYYVFYNLRMNGPHVMGAFEMKDGKPARVYGLPFCDQLNEKWERVWVRCAGDTNPAE